MDSGATRGILRDIHTLYTCGTMGGWTDSELLERFLARGDSDAEDAFATLVARHGPMVLGVCRRMLRASHDAEDAFQATFLVLARRAGTIVRRDRVASWLYGVAVRTAQVARRRELRSRTAERRLTDATRVESGPPEEDREELLPILDEELNRLPQPYRAALVACELEGKSRREAARQLGIPEGTLSARLARGRKMLRDRMRRRGATLGLGPIAGQLGPLAESAVPERLIGPVVRAALADGAGEAAVATAVSCLAERVLRMMLLARLTLIAAVVLTAAAGVVTAVALGRPARDDPGERAAERPVAGGRDRFGDPIPDGAVARLGSVRFRNDDTLSTLFFSSDGRTLLTVSNESTMRLWETATGRLLRESRPVVRGISVHAAALSPDGRLIAIDGSHRTEGDVAGFDHIRLLVEVATGKEVRRLPVADRVNNRSLVFTPDGKALMSLEHEGGLRVEDVASGAELAQQKVPSDNMGSLAVSPDGRVVAVWAGPNRQKVFLWDWRGGGEPREVEMPRERVSWLAFHPDGKTLAAAGDLEPFVCEWDVATGRLRKQIDLPDNICPSGLSYAPDGETIAVSDSANRRPRLWSGGVVLVGRGTGKVVRELETPGVPASHATYSPDGRWLAAVSGVGVRVWDARTGEEVAAGVAGHHSRIMQIAAGRGGLIVTASDDQTVRVWDAATGTERRRLSHDNWVRALALSPDGRLLVTSSLDDSVRLWNLESGEMIYKLPGHGRYGGHRAVGFASDGRRFLSWGDDDCLRAWDVRTGKLLAENVVGRPEAAVPDDDEERGGPGVQMKMAGPAAFARDGRRLVKSMGATYLIVETATGQIERSVGHPGGHVMSLAVAPDGRNFASSAWGRPVQRKLPDGRVQHTTPNHHTVRLVEMETGKLVCDLDMPTPDAGPLAFSADGKLLAIGMGRGRGEVRLVDVATQETAAVLSDFGSPPHALAFSADGKYLVTGLTDGSALVWDLARVLAGKGR
jgi:RNA polymerase sigma factor (sigma-70 family)